MNILFVYPTVFDPSKGGVETVTDMLARKFAERGHRITYLHTYPNNTAYEEPFESFCLPTPDFDLEENYRFYQALLEGRQVDIVINQCGAHGDSFLFNHVGTSKAKTISVIHFNPKMSYDYYWHEISVLRNHSLKEQIKRLARVLFYRKIKADYLKRLQAHYTWLFGHTDCVCLLSNTFKDELKTLAGDRYVADKVAVVSNPVYLKGDAAAKKEKIILWVGRFDMKQKRPDRCIRIWRKICDKYPDWRLIMVGDGKSLEAMKQEAHGMERITFTGFTNPEPYYESGEILMMTSNFEGWGMVLTESMAHGVVPVAYDTFCSLHDIVDHDTLRIAPFDEQAYIQILTRLMEDEDLRRSLRGHYYAKIQKYSIDSIADKWEQLFNHITKHR